MCSCDKKILYFRDSFFIHFIDCQINEKSVRENIDNSKKCDEEKIGFDWSEIQLANVIKAFDLITQNETKKKEKKKTFSHSKIVNENKKLMGKKWGENR